MFEQYKEGDDVEYQEGDGRWVVGRVSHHVRAVYLGEVVGLNIAFNPLGTVHCVVTTEEHRVRPLQLMRAARLGQGTYDPTVGRIDWGAEPAEVRVFQGNLALAKPDKQGFTLSTWVKTAHGPVEVKTAYHETIDEKIAQEAAKAFCTGMERYVGELSKRLDNAFDQLARGLQRQLAAQGFTAYVSAKPSAADPNVADVKIMASPINLSRMPVKHVPLDPDSNWVVTAAGEQARINQEAAMEELKQCPPGKSTMAKRDDHPPGTFTVPKRTIETPLGTFTEGELVEVWANEKVGWLTGRMTVLSGQHRDKQPVVYVNLDKGQLVMFGTDHVLVSVRVEAKYIRRVGLACVCGGWAAKSTCYHWCDAYVAP